MRRRRAWVLATALFAGVAGSAHALARESLSIHDGWGAFRDGERCYAIAEPAERIRGQNVPFLSIVQAPKRGARGQIHARLRFAKLRGAAVTLSIGERRFALIAGGANAWAKDAGQDAAIISAMRAGTSLSIETRAHDGRAFADVYRLAGAATAIDAAALGCAGG